MKFNTEELKQRLNIFSLCEKLGIRLNGKNGLYNSPLRVDKHPSFSISKDGKFFNDFATGDKGDVITFYKLYKGCSIGDAIRGLADIEGLKNSPYKPFKSLERTKYALARKEDLKPKEKPFIQPMHWSVEKAQILCNQRGFNVDALKLAYENKCFGFGSYLNEDAWFIFDSSGNSGQARRLNGEPWQTLNSPKALTLKNSDASYPIGLESVGDKPLLCIAEGSTDFLCLWHFAYCFDCEDIVAPLAMLGASQHIGKEYLAKFKNRYVLIFADNDKAGKKGLENWADALFPYARSVQYFKYPKGKKDLCELLDISVDEWERIRPYDNIFYGTILKIENDKRKGMEWN